MFADEIPATRITDSAWLNGRLRLARALYGPAPDRVLGTVWWYSTSAVLLTPTAESLVAAGQPLDPALDAVTLRILADGRLLGATSSRTFDGDLAALGRTLHATLDAAITGIAAACGAGPAALWAIAADSLAGRMLAAGKTTGDAGRAVELAGRLADAVGAPLPRCRFEAVGPHTVVRRTSCCLIDRATGQAKCASCPNQHPDERHRRIREVLG